MNLQRRRRGGRLPPYPRTWALMWAWRWENLRWQLRPTARWEALRGKKNQRRQVMQSWMTEVRRRDQNLQEFTLCSYFVSLLIFFTFWFVFPPPVPSPPTDLLSPEAQEEEFDSLFDSVAEVPSPKEEGPPPLSDNDLAVFDPCYKQGENGCM